MGCVLLFLVGGLDDIPIFLQNKLLTPCGDHFIMKLSLLNKKGMKPYVFRIGADING